MPAAAVSSAWLPPPCRPTTGQEHPPQQQHGADGVEAQQLCGDQHHGGGVAGRQRGEESLHVLQEAAAAQQRGVNGSAVSAPAKHCCRERRWTVPKCCLPRAARVGHARCQFKHSPQRRNGDEANEGQGEVLGDLQLAPQGHATVGEVMHSSTAESLITRHASAPMRRRAAKPVRAL